MTYLGPDESGCVLSMDHDVWWCVLSNIENHRTQMQLSKVCKGWDRLCKTLPRLSIQVTGTDRKVSEAFITRALQGRSGLQELEICYTREYRQPVDEQFLWRELQPVWTSLKFVKLTIPAIIDWSSLCEHFLSHCEKLCCLHMACKKMYVVPPLNKRVFKNLKCLIFELDYPGFPVQEVVKACSSLEVLRVDNVQGDVVIESDSLLDMSLTGRKPFCSFGDVTQYVIIRACNLESLRVDVMHACVKIHTPKLETLYARCDEFLEGQDLPNLRKVDFNYRLDFGSFLNIMSVAKNVRELQLSTPSRWEGHAGMLKPWAPAWDRQVMLREVVPQSLEIWKLDCVECTLVANDIFRKESEDEIVDLLYGMKDEDMPTKFNLESVVIKVRNEWMDNGGARREFLAVLVEILRCSPRLVKLAIFHREKWDVLKRVRSLDPRFEPALIIGIYPVNC